MYMINYIYLRFKIYINIFIYSEFILYIEHEYKIQ